MLSTSFARELEPELELDSLCEGVFSAGLFVLISHFPTLRNALTNRWDGCKSNDDDQEVAAQ